MRINTEVAASGSPQIIEVKCNSVTLQKRPICILHLVISASSHTLVTSTKDVLIYGIKYTQNSALHSCSTLK
jgi:hypothetical protein